MNKIKSSPFIKMPLLFAVFLILLGSIPSIQPADSIGNTPTPVMFSGSNFTAFWDGGSGTPPPPSPTPKPTPTPKPPK